MQQALQDDEYYYISHEGLVKLATLVNPEDPVKNTLWTNDYTLELPIRMKKTGPASLTPITIVEMFEQTVKRFGNEPALSVKKNKKWQSMSYKQYYDEVCAFGKACVAIGLTPYRSVNIIGFNSPEWFISFYGSIFGYYLPVGVYTTNGPDACQYVASNSDAELIVVENKAQLSKNKRYLKVWDQLPAVKAIVVYNEEIPSDFIPNERKNQVYQWKDFIELGRKYTPNNTENSLEYRMKKQKPGNCCTLVYTSGTTGNPKGVMLTHDNYIYPATNVLAQFGLKPPDRLISYLPLSHVAAQIIDIIGTLLTGTHVYFAAPDALQNSLIETLKEVRPTFFFSVPRVWEKIEEKMKALAAQNGFVKRSISNWAKGLGTQGTFAEINGGSTPICFNVAKRLVYNNVKQALGLDQARYLMFGAAPLSPDIRGYFLSLNMLLINAYGMSECAGGQTISDPKYFDKFDNHFLKSCGHSIPGTEIRIFNPDKDGNGEICYRGRHVFKGYYKNESATRETLDAEGYLHSGDVGKLDSKGNLSITGRIKELLITAGGENVAPVLIEEEIKKELPFISNAMVVGDNRKFLATLLTLKYDLDKNGQLTKQLTPEVINAFKELGSNATTFEEAKKDEIIKKKIENGINKANSRAISNAQQVRKWALIEGDFTVDGGELTPTLKLKRKVASEKHKAVIESFYIEPKL